MESPCFHFCLLNVSLRRAKVFLKNIHTGGLLDEMIVKWVKLRRFLSESEELVAEIGIGTLGILVAVLLLLLPVVRYYIGNSVEQFFIEVVSINSQLILRSPASGMKTGTGLSIPSPPCLRGRAQVRCWRHSFPPPTFRTMLMSSNTFPPHPNITFER